MNREELSVKALCFRSKVSCDIYVLQRGADVIHEGQDPDQWRSRSVVPQISLSTTFKQSAPGVLSEDGFEYSRGGNPTRRCLEECIAKIDGGLHSFVFSSGLAATTALTQLLRAGE